MSELGEAKEWRRILALESTQVTANENQGQTLIRIREQFKGYATVAYSLIPLLVSGIGAPIIFGIGFSPAEGLGILGGVVAGALTVARSIFASRSKKRRANTAKLIQRLQEIGVEDSEINVDKEILTESTGIKLQEGVGIDEATVDQAPRRRIRG